MAIVKIKLTKKINNVVNDYYPKTSADNVVYDSNNTVADKLNSIETTLTAHAVTNKGSAFASGLYKITVNAEGHVTAATAIQKSDITALGVLDAEASHTHAQSDVTGLETALSGKANTSHTHDDRYYTEAEIDAALSEKSNSGHSHDDRYYTEAEVDNLLGGKADAADIPDVSGFITRAVNDLVNYYTKSETYTQSEIDAMVSAIPKFAIEVVNSLPVQDISATTVYLLTVQNGEQGNLYDEYIHVGQNWEKLGTQTVDLSGYYTSAQVDALLSGLPVAGHTHDDRYYTEAEIDGRIQTLNTSIGGKADSGHLHDDRYYTEAETDALLGGKANSGHSHDDRYYTEAETDALLGGKQNALTAGANITIATVNDALTISATDTTYSPATTSAAGLMSAADFKKINPQVIVANTDLNGITEDGWYYCGANSIATTLSNCPTNHAFYLEVHKHAGKYQHIVEYDTNSAAQFHRNLYSGTWGNWVQWKLTDTTYSAGTGLSLSGTTFNHSNSITAGTAKGDDSKTLTFGGTFTIPTLAYDAQGHITSKGTVTMTMPANPNSNTTYTIASGDSNGQIKVTPSSGNAYNVSVKGLGTAAYKAITDTYSATGTDAVSGKAVASAIASLPEPMVFKGSLGTGGTITTLPTNGTATVGDTYKVITAGTYASKAAKIGDTFICLTKTASANTWELIPSGDEPSGTVTSITITATSPISINNSGAITTSGTRTISHATSGVTAGTYKSVTVDNKGHVTAGSNPTTLAGYGITDAAASNHTHSGMVTATTLYNNANGASIANAGTITLDISVAGYSYIEVYYLQCDGMNCAKGTVTSNTSANIQLLSWTFDSANASLSFIGGKVAVSAGTTLTLTTSSSESFTIYRVVGYK